MVDLPVVCRQVIGGGDVCRYAVIFYAVNVDVVVAEHEHAGVEVIDAGQEVDVVGTGHVGVLAGHLVVCGRAGSDVEGAGQTLWSGDVDWHGRHDFHEEH